MQLSKLETILLRDTSLTREQLDQALESQRLDGGTLAEALHRQRYLGEEELLRALAQHLGVEYATKLDPEEVDGELLADIPINYAKAHLILPLHRENDGVKVVMADSGGRLCLRRPADDARRPR
jgi:hypothetical protein